MGSCYPTVCSLLESSLIFRRACSSSAAHGGAEIGGLTDTGGLTGLGVTGGYTGFTGLSTGGCTTLTGGFTGGCTDGCTGGCTGLIGILGMPGHTDLPG